MVWGATVWPFVVHVWSVHVGIDDVVAFGVGVAGCVSGSGLVLVRACVWWRTR